MVEKFKLITNEIEAQKGNFTLFAIMRMDDFIDKWSVLVSADWITDENRTEIFNLVASKMRENLSEEENKSIARIGIFPVQDHITELFLKYKEGFHLQNEKVNGFKVHEAYILKSKPIETN